MQAQANEYLFGCNRRRLLEVAEFDQSCINQSIHSERSNVVAPRLDISRKSITPRLIFHGKSNKEDGLEDARNDATAARNDPQQAYFAAVYRASTAVTLSRPPLANAASTNAWHVT